MARIDSTKSINLVFEHIRSVYFPRWDREHKWAVKNDHPECLGKGLCDYKNKLIIIKYGDPSLVAIHEISHAVADLGHGKKWRERMEKAAKKAASLGHTKLAEDIREDYTVVTDPNRCHTPTAKSVYCDIEDTVIETLGKVPYEDIVVDVANKNDMTPNQLQTKYKKLEKFYEKAIRDMKDEDDTRDRFMRSRQ